MRDAQLFMVFFKKKKLKSYLFHLFSTFLHIFIYRLIKWVDTKCNCAISSELGGGKWTLAMLSDKKGEDKAPEKIEGFFKKKKTDEEFSMEWTNHFKGTIDVYTHRERETYTCTHLTQNK